MHGRFSIIGGLPPKVYAYALLGEPFIPLGLPVDAVTCYHLNYVLFYVYTVIIKIILN